MKKYLYLALAMPMMFACSSDDLLEKGVVSNDQFSGIEKVDATFSMDEGVGTRFDGVGEGVEPTWDPQEGDTWGFAWLTDDYNDGGYTPLVPFTGDAFQNHNLIQTNGVFTPQTSIYIGKYFLYRPYDETTVSPQAINFNSLEEQTIAEGFASSTQAWKNLAKTAINIGDKWTVVTPTGTTDATTGITWNKAGIKQHYDIYAALFSNQTGLDMTYVKNNPVFAADQVVTGATDITFTCAAGSNVGAAKIFGGTIDLKNGTTSIAAKSFTYAPPAEPNTAAHDGTFWATKKNLGAGEGFTFTAGAITLDAGEDGISTGAEGNTGWIWFNSLPVTAGNGDAATVVTPILETSYGKVTAMKDYAFSTALTVGNCAYALNVESGVAVWHPLADAANATTTPTTWGIGAQPTFINEYGNHKGKYTFEVDFSKGEMNNMHIKDDAHLQTALKYYLASGKSETVRLQLDKDADNEFKISKISIALIQTINATIGTDKVLVEACSLDGTHKPARIVITQDGQEALGLADKKEVPALNQVFRVAHDVYLSSACEWTWKGGDDFKTALTIDGGVKSITNEGTLTVNATNVQLSVAASTLANADDATMNITKITTVKNALTNLGTINVGAADNTGAELRAYGIAINNDATSLTAFGTINNYGAVGVTAGTGGTFNNYGEIDMMSNDAITLLSTNELNANTAPDGPFKTPFVAGTNMMGTVVLPTGNPTAIVSVANTDETGFIKYNWTEATYSHDTRNVKYNTLVVSNDIEFTFGTGWLPATEIKFVEFKDCNRAQVVNKTADALLPKLRGVIVNAGSSIIIEKNNELVCSDGAFLGEGATVYKGGIFTYGSTNNYLGTWSTDQIVEF